MEGINLQQMDDRMLHDGGISRGDIPRIVRYGRRSFKSDELAPHNSDRQQSVSTTGSRTRERNEVRSFTSQRTHHQLNDVPIQPKSRTCIEHEVG
jgi:uncharacterized protein YjiS (DUF1127 family)